jgi:hypothetical protein
MPPLPNNSDPLLLGRVAPVRAVASFRGYCFEYTLSNWHRRACLAICWPREPMGPLDRRHSGVVVFYPRCSGCVLGMQCLRDAAVWRSLIRSPYAGLMPQPHPQRSDDHHRSIGQRRDFFFLCLAQHERQPAYHFVKGTRLFVTGAGWICGRGWFRHCGNVLLSVVCFCLWRWRRYSRIQSRYSRCRAGSALSSCRQRRR